jgi:Trp operon repressor
VSVRELAEMLGAGLAKSLAAGAKELRASANDWKKQPALNRGERDRPAVTTARR